MCFSVSPISRARFKLERNGSCLEHLKVSDELETGSLVRTKEVYTTPWWTRLLHPIKLIELIKRQHMVGNLYLVYLFCHLLILAHLYIKAVVYSFFTGSDIEIIERSNDGIYPHMAGFFPKPYLFNNLYLVINFSNLALRLLKTYYLIEASVLNEHHYRKLTITQINVSSLLGYKMSLREWYKFFMLPTEQCSTMDEQDFELNRIAELQLSNLTKTDLMFYINMINFEGCHFTSKPFETSFRSKNKYGIGFLDWHCASPVHRMSLETLRIISFYVAFATCSIAITPAIVLIDLIYLEVTTNFNILRLFEVISSMVFHVPMYLDNLMVQVDLLILIARTKKLRSSLENDLEYCRHRSGAIGRYHNRSPMKDEYLYGQHHNLYSLLKANRNISQQDEFVPLHSNSLVLNQHERYLINQRIFIRIQLVNLIHAEFANLKRAHSMFLSIFIICCGISVSYSIALLDVVSTFGEFTLVFVAILGAFATSMISLIICAGVNREVSRFKDKANQ